MSHISLSCDFIMLFFVKIKIKRIFIFYILLRKFKNLSTNWNVFHTKQLYIVSLSIVRFVFTGIQGRLNSIIGPRAKQCTGPHTYTTTCSNETVNVYKIKHIFIALIFLSTCVKSLVYQGLWLGLLCLTTLSTIFQLYRGGQFYWWRKLEYPEKTTDLPQVTDKLYHRT